MAHTPRSLRPGSAARTPSEKSALFEKVIPIVLISLGAVTVALILFALGVLLGVVRF